MANIKKAERNDIIMPENRDFKGVWIPKKLYISREVTLSEKFLLIEIYTLSKKHICYASNKHFADFTGLKENTVQKALLGFEEKGYVERHYEYKNNTKEIKCRKDISKVSIVGAGMVSHPGVAVKMFEALYDAHININMIATSEIKISVLVAQNEAEAAVVAIHDKFLSK